MANSPSLRFLNHFKNGKGEKKEKSETVAPTVQVSKPSTHQSTVQGWLKSVRSYGQATTKDPISVPLDVDNYSNLIDNDQTNDVKIRPGSLTSEDSVNLDELINANYTSDVDNETDLPDLGELDIDDSVDDFWRLDKNECNTDINCGFDQYLPNKSVVNGYDLDWNPENDSTTTSKTSLPAIPPSDYSLRYKRSSSMSSDNSSNSQSTVLQYAKYGLTPMTYPSESSSTSSRSLSRQSNYSTGSSNTASAISHTRANPSVNTKTGHNIPSPSGSYTLRENNTPKFKNSSYLTTTKILPYKQGSAQCTPSKRASHIPTPATRTVTPSAPQRTTPTSNSKIVTHSNNRLINSQPSTTDSIITIQRRLPQRASHIPTIRETIHRPGSPLHYPAVASSTTRMGLRSPTSESGAVRNSVFPSHDTERSSTPTTMNGRRSMTPTSMRSTRLRTPDSNTGSANGRSLPSRIGSYRK